MLNWLKDLLGKNINVQVQVAQRTKLKDVDDRGIGKVDPICPYCNIALSKFPGSKTKCKSCGNYMFVRTRPSDKKKLLVTKKETDQLEELWAIESGSHENYLIAKSKYEQEHNRLKQRFGKEPKENDILWSLFNKERLDHAHKNNWGLYRNTTLEMADLLKKERNFNRCLGMYLTVCYIDINGPLNNEYGTDRFNPNPPHAFIAPGLVKYIVSVTKVLHLSNEQLKELFLQEAIQVYTTLKTPKPPEVCWFELEAEVNKIK